MAERRRHPEDLSPADAVERYLRRRQQDSTEESVESYHYRLKQFVEFCEDVGIERVGDIEPFDLDEYYEETAARVAKPTLKGMMHTVRGFLRYLSQIDAVDESVPESVQIPKLTPSEESDDTRLETDDALTLLRHFRAEEPGSRRHALLAVLWTTGCRVSGLRALDLRDAHLDEAYLDFRHRPKTDTALKKKVDGERPVAIPEETVAALRAWLRNRPDVNDGYGRAPLFPSQRGRPTVGTLRGWCYVATIPCAYGACPHERDPPSCEWTRYQKASQCPSSRSPHQVRTGSITYQRDLGFPAEVVAERTNASLDTIERHYDKAGARERMEQRRRPYVQRFSSDNDS